MAGLKDMIIESTRKRLAIKQNDKCLLYFTACVITFQLLHAVEQLKTKLETLEPELHDEKAELFEVTHEVHRMKAEIFDLKQEDQRKKAEIFELKQEVQRVNVQIDALHTQQAHQISEEFDFIYATMLAIRKFKNKFTYIVNIVTKHH